MNQAPPPHIHTVLFDLDGTLLDTAPDLADALNRVLEEQGQPPLPLEVIRPHASHGTLALLRLGFQLGPDDPGFEPLRQRLLEIYRDNIANKTRLFPGTETLLHEIERLGLNWGVVTNKPAFLTEPLLQQLGLAPRAACIVSGDTTANRKPDPEPMLHACHLAGSKAEQCLYIGDAQRDIEAGKNAGMHTLVALYGYIGEQDQPETWGADSMIHHPGEIMSWLK